VLDQRHDYAGEVKALEPAIARLRTGQAPGTQLAALLTQLGFAYQSLGRNDRAIDAFEQVRAATPDDASGSVYLVQAYLVGNRNGDAVTLAEKAREKFPDDLRLTELLAEGYRRQGHVDRGIALLEKTLQTRDAPSVYVSLSELYAGASRTGEAVDLLTRARARFPDNEDVLFQLGTVLEQAHRDAEAEQAFRDLLERDPLNAQALNYLGYMLADRGRSLDEAVALITRALARDPGNASYRDSLGWAYYKLGRLDLAVENLRQAASELTTNSVVQDHLGDVLFRLKRVDEAIAAWQRALDGDGASIERDVIEAKIKDARKQGSPR
jgi:tetratricopeptide (TPR) repeat protein